VTPSSSSSGAAEGEASITELEDVPASTFIGSVTTTSSTVASRIAVIPPQLLATSVGDAVSVTSTLEVGGDNDRATTDDITDDTRAALLDEIADEYGDPFRYGASGGSVFVPLEDKIHEDIEDVELVPADLLDVLAAAVATA
ncbi:MAG: hypothetical protein ABI614_16610, partial [Planctomycetota bacterium]